MGCVLVGLHIRFTESFHEVFEKAQLLSLPFFQSFFVYPNSNKPIDVSPEALAYYREMRGSFSTLYAHSSYAINLAQEDYHPLLKKELYLAQKLEFSSLIFHLGAVPDQLNREQAIEAVIRRLNVMTRDESSLSFILENSAHLRRSLGGDIHELASIRSRLDRPEKVFFCIDTAHAYVFGYRIKEEFDQWINLVLDTLTPDALTLIHLNDTQEACGSGHDRHCMLGRGALGTELLKKIVQHPQLSHLNFILELPSMSDQEELQALNEVRSWINRE
jgi:deoxyribonuclease IV